MTAALDDMRARWLPTDRARRHAVALLAAEPAASVAVLPLFQPGKRYGIWVLDQLVCTVAGVVFLAVDSREPAPGLPPWRWATEAACELARAQLRARKQAGTVAYALVYRGNQVVVFEDYGNEDE